MDKGKERLRCTITGRFSTNRKVNKFNRLKKLGLSNSKNNKNVQADQSREKPGSCNTAPVEGCRIIDMQYLHEQLICSSSKADLSIKKILKEKKQCLGSSFNVECDFCDEIKVVHSSKKYNNPTSGRKVFQINSKMALGKIF